MKASSRWVLMGLALHQGLPATAAVPSLHTRPESEDTGILHRGVHRGKEESGTLNLLVRCTEAGLPDGPCGDERGSLGAALPWEKTTKCLGRRVGAFL